MGMKESVTWKQASSKGLDPLTVSVSKQKLLNSADWIIAIFFSASYRDKIIEAVSRSSLAGPLGDGMRQSVQWSTKNGPRTCFHLVEHPNALGDDIVCVRVGSDFGASFPAIRSWFISVGEESGELGWMVDPIPRHQPVAVTDPSIVLLSTGIHQD